MSGTKTGGQRARDKNLARDPDFYKRIGTKGGSSGTGHTFAHGKRTPQEVGRLGGIVSGKSKRGEV